LGRHSIPDDTLVNKLFKWKPITSITQGRRKSRWEDDVLNDIKQVLTIGEDSSIIGKSGKLFLRRSKL
jgi:hypothetical protein